MSVGINLLKNEIMNDKMYEYVMDATECGIMSECCGATVYNENDGIGICGDCKEHCTVIDIKS